MDFTSDRTIDLGAILSSSDEPEFQWLEDGILTLWEIGVQIVSVAFKTLVQSIVVIWLVITRDAKHK
jgi:hypothetical protein